MQMTTNQTNRTRRTWPEAAQRLVRKAASSPNPNKNALLLHSQLQDMTGYSCHTCWRFLERHKIYRPGAGQRIDWDPKTLDLVMQYGYDLAAQKLGCTKSKLYAFVRRQGRSIGRTTHYSVRQISTWLCVRPDVVHRWIETSLLEATKPAGNASSYTVSEEQFRNFLKQYAAQLVPLNRFPQKRAQFLTDFLYDGKHMDLNILRTRESKKEGDAFRNGEYLPAMRSPEGRQNHTLARD